MRIRKTLCGAGIVLMGLVVAHPAAASNTDVLTKMFSWWNQAFTKPGAYTESALGRFFTKDTTLIINGKSESGLAELAKHFQAIQSKGGSVKIILPFIESFSQGDKVFTYHFVYRMHDGKEECLRTMGYAVIKEQKIALINFVRAPYVPGVSYDKGCTTEESANTNP